MTTTSPIKALELDGASGYVTLAPAQALELYDRDFTVEAWIRIADWGDSDFLMVLGGATNATRQGLHLCVKNRLPFLAFYACDTAGQTELALDTWYHLAWRYTKEGGEQAMFVNGVVDASAPDKESYLGTDTLQIGRFANTHYFRGRIAELRIWRTARTEAEILDRMHRRLTGDEAGLVGVWPLADGEGETAVNVKAALPGRAPYGLEGRPLSGLEVRAPHVLSFDGTDDYVRMDLTVPRTESTYEIWFKTTQENDGLWVFRGTAGGYERDLWLADGQLHTCLWTWEEISTTGLTLTDGNWHHVAHVFGASVDGQRLYVDGVLCANGTKTTSDFTGQDYVLLGFANRASHDRFTGQLAEFRIWTRTLSGEEIRAGMHRRLTGTESDLLLYLPLDEGTAGPLASLGSSGADATLTGSPTWNAVTAPDAADPISGPPVAERYVLELPAASVLAVPHVPAQVLRFDGVDDHIDVTLLPPLTECTHELWFKTDQTDGGLLGFRSAAGGNDRDIYLQAGQLRAYLWGSSSSETIETTDLSLTDGEWHHVAHVFGASVGGQHIYVDGVLQVSGTKVDSDFTSQEWLRLGYTTRTSPNYFAGEIAEVRLWSRALTEEEIVAGMGRKLRGTEPDLLACFALDQDTGDEVRSCDAARLTGELEGSPTWLTTTAPDAAVPVTGPPVQPALLVTYTFEAWIYVEEQPAEPGAALLARPGEGDEPFTMLLLEPLGSLQHRFTAEDGNAAGPDDTEFGSVPLKRWTHVAITHDGTTARTLINGVEAASAEVAACQAFAFGFTAGGGFQGRLAELRLWSTARTVDDIAATRHRRLRGDETGLVGYWPLDESTGETVRDLRTTAAHPGQVSGALRVAPRVPFAGEEAVELAGDGSWIEIPHAPDVHFAAPDQDFTIELQVLAARVQPAGESERVVLEKWGGGGGFPYSLRYRHAGGAFVFARSSGATPHPEIVSGSSFDDGCFHHLAAVREGTTLRLYVDGELEGETTDTVTSTIRGTSPLYLGGRARKSHFLKGAFCELRLWRRARSQTEIRSAVASRLTGDELDLAGYQPLDATDVAAEDLSIHCGLVRPQGTLTSAAWADAEDLPVLALAGEGVVAPALEFDGERSAVTVPASEALAVSSALTVEAWVQPAAGGGSAFLSPVVSRCDATSGWELCANDQEFAFAVTVGGTRCQVSWSPPAAAGRWMHLAGVFDGTRLQLHVNGRPVPSAGLDAGGVITAAGGALCLGRSAYWSGRRFRGRLAEVRVWNVARSAVEIDTHLYRRLAGDEQGLAGYWPLSEGTGETVAHPGDETLHGTAEHAAWVAAELPPRLPAGEIAVFDPAAMIADLEAGVAAQAEELRKAVQRQKYREKRIAELSDQLALVDEDWARERAALRASLEGEIADRQEQLNAIDAAQRDTDSEVVDALLDDVVKDTHAQIESARRELADQGSEYQLGPVSVEVKYVAGAAGRGALFPGAETEVEGERVTRLHLNLGAGKVPEPAAAVPAAVPSVIGLTELMARSNLNAAGFLAEVHGQVVTADDQVGKVVSQLPAALTEAEPNSAVRVFLGKAG